MLLSVRACVTSLYLEGRRMYKMLRMVMGGEMWALALKIQIISFSGARVVIAHKADLR